MGRLDLPDVIRDEDIYPIGPVPDFRHCGHKFILSSCVDCKDLLQARVNARLAAKQSRGAR